jgi:hypothetical protein
VKGEGERRKIYTKECGNVDTLRRSEQSEESKARRRRKGSQKHNVNVQFQTAKEKKGGRKE